MPFNPPSSTLMNLLGWLTDAAKGVVTTAEEKIGDANNNMPVGTAQALIEQGAKVFSAIHARLHRSQAKSLSIISRINHWYLEDMDNQSGEEIEIRDFAYNNDVRPVSDPNIFSETQRLAQNQAILQMAQTAPPGMFDLRAMYRRVMKQLKIPSIDEILPNPQGATEANPALENVSMTMGRPSAAYPDQDHIAHIQVHLEYIENPAYGGSPLAGPTTAPHMLEHLKQHLTLHYLQSMRAYVAHASGDNKDTMSLHEERPIDKESQQALALAGQMVNQDSQQILAPFMDKINALAQKVSQMQQQQQQAQAQSDPTAQAIVTTQMAETKRKAEESQAKMQMEAGQTQQTYQLDMAELKRKLSELQIKYDTQNKLDANRNATQIAVVDMNNSSRERIAEIAAHAAMTSDQLMMQHEQDQTALAGSQAAQQDIRKHGIDVQQQAMDQQQQQQQQMQQHAQEQQQQAQQHAQEQQQAQQAQQAQQQQQQAQHAQEQQMAQQQQPTPGAA